jgi:hypothetical protein
MGRSDHAAKAQCHQVVGPDVGDRRTTVDQAHVESAFCQGRELGAGTQLLEVDPDPRVLLSQPAESGGEQVMPGWEVESHLERPGTPLDGIAGGSRGLAEVGEDGTRIRLEGTAGVGEVDGV